MTEKPKSFLGTGWDFPPTFDNNTRKVSMLSDLADIRSSLEILLSTSIGERVMQYSYGSNLTDYIFEPMNETLRGFLKKLITEAIYLHEPRVVPENVVITDDLMEGIVRIEVFFRIPATNSRSNVVFPYYLLEGTNLK